MQPELARTFLDMGAEYERYRPGFPDDAVAVFASERLGDILDLGAGTGKLTRKLVPLADRVVAVDPSEPMLDQLRMILPAVDVRVGTAEDIPAPDRSQDLVTVAQAFHWFDESLACAEIARVLRPGGALALLWNTYDPECAWDRACARVLHPGWSDQISERTLPPAMSPLPGFRPVTSAWIPWSERITRDDYLARWMTVSTARAADEDTRADMLSRLEEILDHDPDTRGRTDLDLHQGTEVYVYRHDTGIA
ncbi:class I SAM-dependent methyltransferase [Microbacterium sp. JZ70]